MKNSSIHIKVSTKDKEKLKERANMLGLSLSSYCTIVLLNHPEIQLVAKK